MGNAEITAELTAMSNVAAALADLDEPAQQRVLQWAAARFGVTVKGGGHGPAEDENDDEGEAAGVAGSDGHASYEHFAELFDAASPKTNPDRALVAAYWVQVHGGHETWGSQQLNKELKNLGHGLTHINGDLRSNMNTEPKRVIQLKKSGSSQQARKTYKVTTEGIKVVQKMLGDA